MPEPSVCPRCHETRSASGACSCDGGPPPGEALTRRASEAAASSTLADLVRDVRAERAARAERRGEAARQARAREEAEHAATGDRRLQDVDDAARDLLACGIPGTGGAAACDRCLDRLALMLREVPQLVDELNLSRAGGRGIDYRTLGGGSGGSKSLPLVVNAGAYGARDRLRVTLRNAVVGCQAARVEHTSPREDEPHHGDIPAMAEWLRWRIDDMTRHPTMADTPSHIAKAIERVLVVIDSPPRRTDLGTHTGPAQNAIVMDGETPPPCGGRYAAVPGEQVAQCRRCGSPTLAEPLREKLLAEAADKWMTAAEIADLASHLKLRSARSTVHDRIRLWGSRGLVERRELAELDPAGGKPKRLTKYRFGEVRDRLVAHDNRHTHSWTPFEPAATQPDDDVVHLVRRCQFEGCDETSHRTRPARKAKRA